MKALIDSKVIIVVTESTYTTPRVISFNKNYEQWKYRTTVQQVYCSSTDELEQDIPVEPQFNTTVEPQFHQEKKTINKTIKKTLKKDTYSKEFEEFYSLYLRSECKKRTYTNWKTQLKTFTVEQLMTAARNYIKAKAGTEIQFMKSSANFLGKERPFEDYLTGSDENGGNSSNNSKDTITTWRENKSKFIARGS